MHMPPLPFYRYLEYVDEIPVDWVRESVETKVIVKNTGKDRLYVYEDDHISEC